MAAATLDIELARNEDWARGFIATDNADPPVPLDLTGATFDLDIRFTHGTLGAPIVDVPVLCEEPETGYFEFVVNGSAFADIGNPNRNIRFVYDLVITQDGRRLNIVAGTILLRPGVSNNEA